MARERGVTLVEVMIALVIVSVALIPMMGLLTAESRQTGQLRDRIIASRLAANVLERLRLEPVAKLRGTITDEDAGRVVITADELLTPAGAPATFRSALVRFDRTALFTPDPDPAWTEHRGVLAATVRWTEDGRARAYALSCVVADRSPEGGPR